MAQLKMNVKIWFNIPMPMRDGALLYANIYRPDNNEKYPAILNRTPYLKDGDTPLCGYIHALEIAAQGYNVVIQDVRGAGYSDGVIDPAGNQVEDGYDSVEWIAAQDWCDGNVGMVGESYHGFSQLAAAQGRPPHLKAICPFQTSWTKFPAIYSFGVFSNMLYGWIYGQAYSRMRYFPELLSQETLNQMHEYEKDGDRQLRWLPVKDTPAANLIICHITIHD
jgi:putative CocE/NonD family hydrolase